MGHAAVKLSFVSKSWRWCHRQSLTREPGAEEAVATVKSPVAVVESQSPSVQRKDVENAVFHSPPVVPDDSPLLHGLKVIFLFVSSTSLWKVLIAGPVANNE